MVDKWNYKHVDDFTKGLNVNLAPDKIDDGNAPVLSNVVFRDGKVVTDTGYITVGSTVRGTPKYLAQYEMKSGATQLVLFTDETAYYWNSGEWQYIHDYDEADDNNATTLTSGGAAGQTVLAVTATLPFDVDDYMGLILDNGAEHKTTVAAVTSGGLTITMTDAIPVGRSANLSARVCVASSLSGSDTSMSSSCAWPADDWLIYTNGIDNVKRYDGTDIRDIPNMPESGDVQCKIVRIFNNHILLINTTEGGVNYPQRVRNSDTADGTDWSAGNAGYTDLWESAEHIFCSEHLGPYLIHYKKTSVVRQEYVGSAANLFNFVTTITEDGAISADGVISKSTYHVVMGNSFFYIYEGGYTTQKFGNEVWNRFFGPNSILTTAYKRRVISMAVDKANEYWWLIPVNGSSVPNLVIKYNKDSNSWTERTFAEEIIFGAVYQLVQGQPWSASTGGWTSGGWEFSWSDLAVGTGDVRVFLCGDNPNQVYEYDFEALTDNGSSITWSIESKDFLYPDGKLRFNRLDARVNGDITVEYSTDAGGTWTSLGSFSESSLGKARLFLQQVSEKIRLKFRGTTAGTVEWFAIQLRKESDW